MSLLTPPSSSHRSDKENKHPVAGPSTRRVVWAPQNSFHDLNTPPKPGQVASKQRPTATRSILKKNEQNTLFLPVDMRQQRDVTPEPSDPLVNLHYLDHPVSQVLFVGNEEKSLNPLIEGYNVLAARLRASVSDSTDADASWPLFQPLRKNAQAITDAVVRDLGCAFIDPLAQHTSDISKYVPLSPQSSPANSKKKGGMTAEQVKYARDLCTTCHSALKFLGAVFSFPAIYNIFDEQQLRDMLTAALKIPLAEELPTPNARKTWALTTWLIQVQRLPAEILRRFASRIAQALQRGIGGELGKEGKKGSVNDGLKAIHDLCVSQPELFVPAFTPLLPSILKNLLAGTLALRTQACHALGGFVLGSISIPFSHLHTQIANHVANYLTTITPSPNKKPSPTKLSEAAIARTLRTAMSNTEPVHVAQGPIWAMSVLACFVVLLGSRLSTDMKVLRIISALLSLGMRTKKSSVRALCCIVWRTITWSYLQPPLPHSPEEGEEEIDEDERTRLKAVRDAHCRVMITVVDCQVGVSTIAALLNNADNNAALKCTVEILQMMASKAGPSCGEAIDTMKRLVSFSTMSPEPELWSNSMLLPRDLFESSPGLLTTEYKNLVQAVRPLFEEVPTVDDVRSLTKEEMGKEGVFDGMMKAWRVAMGCLEMFDGAKVPGSLVDVWSGLLNGNVGLLQETGDDAATCVFSLRAVQILVDILEDQLLDFKPKKLPKDAQIDTLTTAVPDSDDTVPEFDGPTTCSNGELRMRVVRTLWRTMKTVFEHRLLGVAGQKLVAHLMKNEKGLVFDAPRPTSPSRQNDDEDHTTRARTSWVDLCVEVLSVCEADALKVFWGFEDGVERQWGQDYANGVWKTFVKKWKDSEAYWEGGVVLLGVPFTDGFSWCLTTEDYIIWEEALSYTTGKALDHGVDSSVVLDNLAAFVSLYQTPGSNPSSSTRLLDLMLSNLEADMRDIPSNLLDLVSETMRATYPPEPRNKPVSMWMARSLAAVVEHCPVELCMRFLQQIQDGLCLWLVDECGVWTEDEMNYDVIPLYQHILVRIQSLPDDLENLKSLAPILDSVFRVRVPQGAVEAFRDYWTISSYSRMTPPTEGWPEEVQHCLMAIGLLSEAETTSHTPTTPLKAGFVHTSSSPRTPIASSFSTPPTAIIKREILARLPSPQRPQKTFGTFPIVPSSPESPVRRRSTGRTPRSSIRLVGSSGNLAKRRKIDREGEGGDGNKENIGSSLSGEHVPVAERIGALKDAYGAVAGKKRRLSEDEDCNGVSPVLAQGNSAFLSATPTPTKKNLKGNMKPRAVRPAKKARLADSSASPASSLVSSSSEDERWVEQTLLKSRVPFPIPDASATVDDAMDAENTPRIPATYRRRGTKLKAVVELSIRVSAPLPKPEKTTSLGPLNASIPKIDFCKLPPIRRSTSIPESMLIGTSHLRKKRKRALSIGGDKDGDDKIEDLSSAAPLPALLIPRPAFRPAAATKPLTLRRAYTLPSSDSDVMMPPASSDDDPHLGQVTPHGILSPALQRRAGFKDLLLRNVKDTVPSLSFPSFASSSTKTTLFNRKPTEKSTMLELFGDDIESDVPGSDDSVLPSSSEDESDSSPTKGVVKRQIWRMGSLRSQTPTDSDGKFSWSLAGV